MTPKILIRDFQPGDLNHMGKLGRLLKGAAEGLLHSGLSYTALVDEKPEITAGLVPMWSGVAEAWAALGDYAQRHPMWSHRLVKKQLKQLIDDNDFHRVQMHVTEGDLIGERWAEALGFQKEGLMHAYTNDGKNMTCFAIWRK